MVSDTALLASVGILGIVVLECVALTLGYNGTMLKLALVAIAGLAGWAAPQLKLKGGNV